MIKLPISLHFFFLLCLFISCNNEASKDPGKNIPGQPVGIDTLKKDSVTKKSIDINLDLVSLEIVDSNSNNIYKKFGIISSGMCYDCNLANISIFNKSIVFSNICDSTNRISYDISNIGENGGAFEINTKENKFILEKINQTPIFRLSVKDNLKLHENLKLVEYYTGKKEILKFKIHDCGDFGG